MNKKFEQLKMLCESVRKARKEKENAELSITSVDALPLTNNCPYSCLTAVALVEGREPLYVSLKCQLFKKDQSCKKVQCPAFEKNSNYVKAYNEYETARQVRREFIKGFFSKTK